METQRVGIIGEKYIDPNGVERYSGGRSVADCKAYNAAWYVKNRLQRNTKANEWYAANRPKRNLKAQEYARATVRRVRSILGEHCAWSDLGGCEGDLEVDHIVPPGLRRHTGYTSHGHALNCWIVNNPELAKLRLQSLCNEHNRFKSNRPNHEARALWRMKCSH